MRRAARSLQHLAAQQQALLQQHAAFGQVAALHAGCLSHLPGSTAANQPEPAVQAGAQQLQRQSLPGRPQEYHAAVVADQPHDAQQQHQQQYLRQQHEPSQPWHAVQTAIHKHRRSVLAAGSEAAQQQPTTGGGHVPTPPSEMQGGSSAASVPHSLQQAGSAAETGSAVSDGTGAAAAAAADPPEGDASGVFLLSTPEEQYSRTVASLHAGRSKNLDQLAHMFDPQAVLTAPDRGAGILEALMFAAAKLQDLQLLRQLLRCTAAAGNTLSSTGHRAVLHCLASCDRPAEALEWLQLRVPEQQLTPQLLRSLVQQLLRQRQGQAAQRALDFAEPKLLQRWQQELQAGQGTRAAADAGSTQGQQQQQQQPLSLHDMQDLPMLRLATAAAAGELSAVQEQWEAILRQAETVQQWLHGSSTQSSMQQQQEQQLDLLGVAVWSSYALALGKAAKRSKRDKDRLQAATLLQDTVLQVLGKYQAGAWASYAQQQAALVQPHGGDQQDAATSQGQQQQQQQQQPWVLEQRAAAEQAWQQQQGRDSRMGWRDVCGAAVLPQVVASAARFQERQLCRQALQAALATAAGAEDEAQVQQLLQLGSVLKFMPQAVEFEALLQLKLKQGAPPEALEELLGEMMGWGVVPTVGAYEAVMEGHALHQDLPAAEGVLDRLQAAGHHPVLRTYNRLLHGVGVLGDLPTAIRVYNRLRLQGLQPDTQTMRALFKCVRMYASNVRVATARTISQAKAGDRDTIMHLLSQRSALFASAYSQLVLWQRDMVVAGLKHTGPSMQHLTGALERLGAVEDCLQLVKLSEDARPGDLTAHRAAIRVAGRTRDVWAAGEVSKLATNIAQGQGLAKQDYLAIISSQFWLKQDHEQLLQTVAAMRAAGHSLSGNVLQQLLHVYCHNGMWGEALQVLNDVAAGRFSQPGSSTSGSGSGSSKQSLSRGARRQGPSGLGAAADGRIDSDQLWHVVLRKLWERRASDELLNDFLRHMPPAQLQRFKLLYGLQHVPGQPGQFTLRPLEDWQIPLKTPAPASAAVAAGGQLQQQQQQQEAGEGNQQLLEHDEHVEELPASLNAVL